MDWRILGPVELVAGERRLRLAGARQRALLALLLVRVNEVVPADWLVEELWDGAAQETARSTLRSHVAHLRKSLDGCGGALVTQTPGYVLRV